MTLSGIRQTSSTASVRLIAFCDWCGRKKPNQVGNWAAITM